MRLAFPEALVSSAQDLEIALSCIPDNEDRHVLACGIRGGAYAIVTSNTKDFPEELNSALVMEKLDNQAAAIGKERRYILERLRVLAPTFVSLVESCES